MRTRNIYFLEYHLLLLLLLLLLLDNRSWGHGMVLKVSIRELKLTHMLQPKKGQNNVIKCVIK